VLSNNGKAQALEIAHSYGMDTFFVDPKNYTDRESHEKEMIRLLKSYSTDLVVAAGYMRILTPHFINSYKNRIINIHPALLPSFPGVHAQEQAFHYGVKITGCTAHFIDEGTDTGPIIMQSAVSVLTDDTLTSLAAKILKEEHRILPEAVKLFCDNKIIVEGRKVKII
jgi:phosphoribosylglycinamide formyltransferase-1